MLEETQKHVILVLLHSKYCLTDSTFYFFQSRFYWSTHPPDGHARSGFPGTKSKPHLSTTTSNHDWNPPRDCSYATTNHTVVGSAALATARPPRESSDGYSGTSSATTTTSATSSDLASRLRRQRTRQQQQQQQ